MFCVPLSDFLLQVWGVVCDVPWWWAWRAGARLSPGSLPPLSQVRHWWLWCSLLPPPRHLPECSCQARTGPLPVLTGDGLTLAFLFFSFTAVLFWSVSLHMLTSVWGASVHMLTSVICMRCSCAHVDICMKCPCAHLGICMKCPCAHLGICMKGPCAHVDICMKYPCAHVDICMKYHCAHVDIYMKCPCAHTDNYPQRHLLTPGPDCYVCSWDCRCPVYARFPATLSLAPAAKW